MANEDLLSERREGVLYLTMNRPAKLNALSPTLMSGLVEELSAAAADPEIGVVVLTGAGRGFCAGGDVSAMNASNQPGASADTPAPTIEEGVARLRRGETASQLLHEMPKVTIAAVNGPAAGAGLSLALACDLRIAADNARFGTAFAKVGFSGDFGGTYSLTQLVGPAKARELYFLADVIGADEALNIGLVNRVVPAATLMEEVKAIANRIARGPRIAYGYMKANLNAALPSSLAANLDREALGQTLTGRTQDHKEAARAFVEKREPKFVGR
jgi:2-(1,2-epoxy-1,2-dihydrophenyl)acetyl-CoA isomerase